VRPDPQTHRESLQRISAPPDPLAGFTLGKGGGESGYGRGKNGKTGGKRRGDKRGKV